MHPIRFRQQHKKLLLLILISSLSLLRTDLVTAAPTPISAPEAIYAALERWKDAWQTLDADSYISSYSPHFHHQQYTSHINWVTARQQRLQSQQWVKLKLSGIVIFIRDDGRYVANFTQDYKSDSFSDISRKQLLFEKYPNGWLIVAENEIEN